MGLKSLVQEGQLVTSHLNKSYLPYGKAFLTIAVDNAKFYGMHADMTLGACVVCGKISQLANGVCIVCWKNDRSRLAVPLQPSAKYETSGEPRSYKFSYNGLYVLGPVVASAVMVRAANTFDNEVASLSKRALAAVPIPDAGVWNDFKQFFWGLMHELNLLGEVQVQWCEDAFHLWNQGFPKSTRNLNLKAWKYLRDHQPTPEAVRKFSIFKFFLKMEKLDKGGWIEPDVVIPRSIQGCSPYAAVATGLYFRSIQHMVEKRLKENIHFAAGSDPARLSEWFMRMTKVCHRYFEDDFTLYDSTFHRLAHELVVEYYERITGGRAECGDPLAWSKMIRRAQVDAPGYTRFGIKYQTVGTMRSGVADTCLSNTLMNMAAHLYSIHVANPLVPLSELVMNVHMAILGDDNLAGLPLSYKTDGMETTMRSLGFLPKLKFTTDPMMTQFLNMRPWPVKEGVRFAPKPGRLIQRLAYSVEPRKLDEQAYFFAVLKAFDDSCAHVPILRVYLDRCKALLNRTPSGMTKRCNRGMEKSEAFKREYAWNLAVGFSGRATMTEDTYAYATKIYGLTREEIASLELYLSLIPHTHVILDNALLDEVVERDR